MKLDFTGERRDCLVRLLFAPAEAARAAANSLSANDGWSWAFQTSETWSVVPQVAARIQALQVAPPALPWAEFKKKHIAVFARSASRAAKGAAALQQLERSGIPAAAFKGLASMARLYPTPAQRSIKDTDILVEPEHVQSAITSLARLEYAAPEGHDFERWDRFVGHSPGFSGNRAIALTEPGGAEVDLHWSLGMPALTPAVLFDRCETLPLFGFGVRVVGAGDSMILTARHAIRENLTVDAICRDLFDIFHACNFLAASGRLEAELQSVASRASLVPLLALTGILAKLEASTDAAAARYILDGLASGAQRHSARDLEALFFHQVRNGALGKDVLYLFHARPVRQILTGLRSNRREYLEFMRSLEEKLEGKELPLGRRLRRLVSDLKNSGPASWRGVRTLGRQKYE